ncbi:MAG: GH36-type glycosyl hydrolase domain-containing protein [Candidatus Hadarchaeota archaeon]
MSEDDERYGYFDQENGEYVIQRPDTPTPWMNYLGEDEYVAMISNTGGGYSFYKDPRYRRILRYRYNNVPMDSGARALYLRRGNGDYWSPTWQPVKEQLDEYECRHGVNYTKIRSSYENIETEVTYFVPINESLEVWRVNISNGTEERVDLKLFSLVEFCLWDAFDDMTNFQRNYNTGEVEVDGNVIYHKTEYRERRNHFAFFACSEDIKGFDTQRKAFLGSYRGFDEPIVVEKGESCNSIAHGWSPIGSHEIDLSLEPNESKEVVFLLGYSENSVEEKFSDENKINKSLVRSEIDRYLDTENLDEAFEELKSFWKSRFSSFKVDTPDEDVNKMVNLWTPYQCMMTFNLARSASFYESGVTRGIGFRDSNQDLLSVIHMIPERAKERILDLAATQKKDGGAYHQYQPLTKEGNEAIGSGFNDDPLWLILSISAYIKETGDYSILREQVVYENEEGTEQPLYDHLERGIQYTLDRLGPHGLPLVGHADWNDCLNLNCFSDNPDESFQTHEDKAAGDTAESIFIAGLFTLVANEMAEISENIEELKDPSVYRGYAESMKETVKDVGWDGDWFLRAYDHFGDKVGSNECEEGKIFIETQGVCPMAGIGLEDGKAERALDSVRKHLVTDHGIVLHQPPFTSYKKRLGEISTYPPGYKENGSVFCHTNPWIMISETKVGRGDRAFDYYKRICPSVRESMSDVHGCEPYVYAQTIAGPDAPTEGEAKNSWLTGTAAWNWVAITEWILGIRPDHGGLRIDPCIPSDWDSYEVEREFRGSKYRIHVKNPEGVSKGISSIEVDGEEIDGNLIPVFDDCEVHEIIVKLGQ